MFGALARRLFGSANDRYVKSLGPIVSAVNELEPELEAMSDDELRARTQQFKDRLADGADGSAAITARLAPNPSAHTQPSAKTTRKRGTIVLPLGAMRLAAGGGHSSIHIDAMATSPVGRPELTRHTGPPISQSAAVRTRSTFRP